jgi:hypothetical protein
MFKSDPNLKEFIDFVSILQFQIVQKTERSSTPENPQGYISYFDLKCNNLFHEEFIQKTNSYVTNVSNQFENFENEDLENLGKYILNQKKYLEKGYADQILFQHLDTFYLHYEISDYCAPIEVHIKNETDFTDIILKSCQSLINKIESLLPEEVKEEDFYQELKDNSEKIIWNGTVSDLTYFMLELNKKGWMELKTNNQNNFSTSATAKLLISHFKLSNGKDIELKNMENSFGLTKLQVSIDRLENELIVPLKK